MRLPKILVLTLPEVGKSCTVPYLKAKARAWQPNQSASASGCARAPSVSSSVSTKDSRAHVPRAHDASMADAT